MVKVLGATSNSLKDTSGNMRDTTKKHNAAVSNVNMNITKITQSVHYDRGSHYENQ